MIHESKLPRHEKNCFSCTHKQMCVYFIGAQKLAIRMHLSGARCIRMVNRLVTIIVDECGEYNFQKE